MSEQISIPDTFSAMDKLWHPHIVARVNDHDVKVAKIDGTFVWHSHVNSDESFYLLDGKLTLEIEGKPGIEMKVGDIYTIPQGVRHRPVAEHAKVLLIEKVGTVNTGNETSSDFRVEAADVRK